MSSVQIYPPLCQDPNCQRPHYLVQSRSNCHIGVISYYLGQVKEKSKGEKYAHANVFYVEVVLQTHQSYRITMFFVATTTARFQPIDNQRNVNREKRIQNIDSERNVHSDFQLYQQTLRNEIRDRYDCPLLLLENFQLDNRCNLLLQERLNRKNRVETLLQTFGCLKPLTALVLEYLDPLFFVHHELGKQNFQKRVYPTQHDLPNWKVQTIIKDALRAS